MLLLALALLALVLGQPQSWTIKCGLPYDPAYFQWSTLHCEPKDLTVNVGDNVTIQNMRGSAIFTINTAERLVDPNTTLVNSLCLLGRAGSAETPIGLLHVGPIDSEPGPTGVVTINSLTTPYSSGFLIQNDTDLWDIFSSGIVIPPPGNYTPYWTVNFTIPGTFTYHGCLEWFMNGTITVLPVGEVPPLTPAQVATAQDNYFQFATGQLAELEDKNNLGSGKYQVPRTINNTEGFKTHYVINGFIDPVTTHFFHGFNPPDFTVTEGDTVSFEAAWYKGNLDDPWNIPHSIRFNSSVTVPGWRSIYLDPTSSTSWFAIPNASNIFTFVNYFPFWRGVTSVGAFDNPKTWLGFGNPNNYVDGELSIGVYQAVTRSRSNANRRNITFMAAGTFPYICVLHVGTGMSGVVTVVPRAKSSTRTRYQVDATLGRFTVSHLNASLAKGWGAKNPSRKFSIVSATHGILTISDVNGVAREDPLLVTITVDFRGGRLTDTQINDFGANLVGFLSNKTWTMDDQWEATHFVSVNNASIASATYVVQYDGSSAAFFGSSLLVLLVSLFVVFQ